MTTLQFSTDTQNLSALAPEFPADKVSATLAAGANANVTVPTLSGSKPVLTIFLNASSTSSLYIATTGSAAAPTGSSFISTNSIPLPVGQLRFAPGTIINILNNSASASEITVCFYVPGNF